MELQQNLDNPANKNHSKKAWVIVAVATALLILAGGAYGAYFYYQKNYTAGWQTYRNDKYGFEVKYPKEWTALFGDPRPGSIVIFMSNEKFNMSPSSSYSFYVSLFRTESLPESKFSLRIQGVDKVDYSEQKKGDLILYKTTDVSAHTGVLDYFIKDENGGYIEIMNDPNLVGANPLVVDVKKYDSIYYQILSTFKFIK